MEPTSRLRGSDRRAQGGNDSGPGYHVPSSTARIEMPAKWKRRGHAVPLLYGPARRDSAADRTLEIVRPNAVVVALAVAVVAAGCVGSRPAPSFDPAGPCTTDGQRPGAYPELERLIPPTFEGAAPATLDSGRNCTEQNLGTLAGLGIREVRFAGGLWETGARSGFRMAVFTAPGLDAEAMADFYEAGARAGRKTEDVKRSVLDLDGKNAWMISTLNGESYQTIVVWDASQPGTVRAVLVGSDVRETEGMGTHTDLVQRAIAAFSGP